ncbi:hypothetical protein EDB89DRAFT_2062328 [Lactarius sanguifluus]|nr:hypothetical protein EDB89DRAFT_2062328 [Lactarius sanguifluus]
MQPREHTKRAQSSRVPSGSGPPPTKKTRFVEPADDSANFAEEVDAALENPSAARKGRVKTDGYDSDSSDDGEGVVLSRRAGGDGTAKDDDDEDMFATKDDDRDKATAAESGEKKKEEFLRLGDIEGQEFGRGSDDDGGESSGEDEPEDEDDAERRKKAGMGYELSSFNMREEMEEGKFSADGMYVRNFDPHALHDRWMDGLGEREIKLARKRKRRQEKAQKEKIQAEQRELEELGGKEAVEREFLLHGRTKASSHDPRRHGSLSDVEQLTHLASTLLSLGDTDIYSRTYEELVRSVRSAGRVDASWVPPSADVKYEYKWDVPGSTAEQGQVFGPYIEEEMQSWYKAAYFGLTGEKVKLRPVGGDWGSWSDFL